MDCPHQEKDSLECHRSREADLLADEEWCRVKSPARCDCDCHDPAPAPSGEMNFVEALQFGRPMRRRHWQRPGPDGEPDWKWYVIDADGDWLAWDALGAPPRTFNEENHWTRDDMLATDWEVWPLEDWD